MHRIIERKYEVVVIGGGAGGLCAAIAAAREGAKTVLVERSAALGGAAASGLSLLGFLDRRGRKTLGGLPQEIMDRLQGMHGAIGHNWCPVHNSISPLSPDMFKILAVEMCEEAGVDILFNCDLTDVQVVNGRVQAVTVYGKCTDIRISGGVFVDGTGDGDLAYLAGCQFISGQDGTGIKQPSTLVFTITGYDIERFFAWTEKNPSEIGIKEEYAKGYDTAFMRRTKGHCLIGLTDLVQRAKAAGDFPIPRNQFIYISTAVQGFLAINTVRITNIDASDPLELSRGLREGYQQVHVLLKFMRKYVPGFENVVVSNISPTLGVRETRHFRGIKRLVKEQMFAYEVGDDALSLCAYNVDTHSGTSDHIDLALIDRPFGLPYGCFVAKDVANLFLAGRTLSVDSTVFAAARVMGPLMAASEGIGIAAAQCVREGVDPAQVNVAKVRETLLQHGAVLQMGDV